MPSNTRKKRSVAGGRRINVGDVPTHPLTSAPYPANPPMPVVIPRAIGSGVCSSRPSAEAPTRVTDNPMVRSVRSPPPPPPRRAPPPPTRRRATFSPDSDSSAFTDESSIGPFSMPSPPRRSPPSRRPPLSAFHPDPKRSMSLPPPDDRARLAGFPRRKSPPTQFIIQEGLKQDPLVFFVPEFKEYYNPSQEKSFKPVPPPSAVSRRRRTSIYGYEGRPEDVPYYRLPATTITPSNERFRRMSEPTIRAVRLGNGRRGRAVGKGVCSSRPSAEEPKPEGPEPQLPSRPPPPPRLPQTGPPQPRRPPPPRMIGPLRPPPPDSPYYNPYDWLPNPYNLLAPPQAAQVVANPIVAAQAPVADDRPLPDFVAHVRRQARQNNLAVRRRRDPAATLDADELIQDLPPQSDGLPYDLGGYSDDDEGDLRARGRGHPTMRQEVSGAPRPPRVFAPKERIDNSGAEAMALMQSLGIPEDMMGMMTGSGSVKSRRKSSRKTM